MKRNSTEQESSQEIASPRKSPRIIVHKEKTFVERCVGVLEAETVEIFPKPSKLIVFDSESSLEGCFRELVDHNILSAPVWDAKEKKYIGFLDLRDLVPIVLGVHDDKKSEGITDIKELTRIAVELEKATTVKELSKLHPFVPIKSTEKLSFVIHILSGHTLRRVPVVNEAERVVNIISQSSILQLLSERCIIIPEKEELDISLKDRKIGTSPVLSVYKNASVIETFRKLQESQRSGVALVDYDGRLAGTTTAKDLGLFLKNPNLGILHVPIIEHLNTIREQSVNVKTPCISVFPEDKLSRAMGLLVATRVHRIFVVDDEKNFRPTRVISISDILKYLDGEIQKK